MDGHVSPLISLQHSLLHIQGKFEFAEVYVAGRKQGGGKVRVLQHKFWRKWSLENEPTAPAVRRAGTHHTAAVKNRHREILSGTPSL